MTLDTTKPSDALNLVSELGSHIREDRAAINALETAIAATGSVSVQTDYICSAGQTFLVIGTDLSSVPIEVVMLSGAGVATIQTLLGGTKGQIKVVYLADANVAFLGSTSLINGTIRLNQLPATGTFGNFQGDIIVLVNIDGNPSAGDDGYWRELLRTPAIV